MDDVFVRGRNDERQRREAVAVLVGAGQMLTMPPFFASNAIYPLSIMPPWCTRRTGEPVEL